MYACILGDPQVASEVLESLISFSQSFPMHIYKEYILNVNTPVFSPGQKIM